MNISVLNTQGKEVSKLELDANVFDGKVRNSLMHQAVVIHLANQRMGLASTKTRGEVSGGGKKPWRQKGTGRARVGSTRSPLWRKGGITFGPKPHSFRKDLPNRMKILALKSALNSKLNDKEMIVLEGLKINSPKTKDFFDKNLKFSCRNLPNVDVDAAASLNTYYALDCKKLIFTKEALEIVEERIKKWLK
jgi:large subunit ribosomal protein L4